MKDKKDEKCPKLDIGNCEEERKDDDPCGMNRKGKTRHCPSDLTKRQKLEKPKKKKDAADYNRLPFDHTYNVDNRMEREIGPS